MNENDKLVWQQSGELSMVAMLGNTGQIKADFHIFKCKNCQRVTTVGLCGCSNQDPELIYNPNV